LICILNVQFSVYVCKLDFRFSVRRREELNEKGARREGRNTASMSSGGRRSGGGFHAARLNDEEVLYVFMCFDFIYFFVFFQFLSF
jgi:hypothetical protein